MSLATFLIVIALLLLSALFSGLLLGLMSLNPYSLARKVKLGNPDALKIYPLRKKGNQLLVTLILSNVAVNSALAIYLGTLTTGVIAGFLATGLIVLFGEVIPQSLFARHALTFGGKTAWLAWPFFVLFYPVAKPLAWILDKALGGELPTIFSRKEFRFFLEEQKGLLKSDIAHHEYEMLEKGLTFSEKQVKDIMTPRVKTYFVQEDTLVSAELFKEIHDNGYTRIPVYGKTPDQITGILYVKDMLPLKADGTKKVKEIMRKEVYYVKETDKLDEVLRRFQQKRVHIFMVNDPHKGVAGIVTLEDVLEQIVGEIMDEYDLIADLMQNKENLQNKENQQNKEKENQVKEK